MGIIDDLAEILRKCHEEFEGRSKCGAAFRTKEHFRASEGKDRVSKAEAQEDIQDVIVRGDNVDFMSYLLDKKDMAGKIQLIYADPPFYSKGKYEAVIKAGDDRIRIPAYDDKWSEGMGPYLEMLCLRLMYMRELTSETGYVCIHLDWHVVHYVKVLADAVFGEENFVNEIIWTYKSGGATKKRFARKHDTLLLYRKSEKNYFSPQKEKSYNRDMRPYRFDGVDEYEDEKGWYTLVNMKDVWEIDMVGRTSSERTGYATQKPEALLKRLIESCSRPGDICADFFGGSGVMAVSAKALDRRFILCDIGKTAAVFQRKRLMEKGIGYLYLEEEGIADDSRDPDISVTDEDGKIVLKYDGK